MKAFRLGIAPLLLLLLCLSIAVDASPGRGGCLSCLFDQTDEIAYKLEQWTSSSRPTTFTPLEAGYHQAEFEDRPSLILTQMKQLSNQPFSAGEVDVEDLIKRQKELDSVVSRRDISGLRLVHMMEDLRKERNKLLGDNVPLSVRTPHLGLAKLNMDEAASDIDKLEELRPSAYGSDEFQKTMAECQSKLHWAFNSLREEQKVWARVGKFSSSWMKKEIYDETEKLIEDYNGIHRRLNKVLAPDTPEADLEAEGNAPLEEITVENDRAAPFGHGKASTSNWH